MIEYTVRTQQRNSHFLVCIRAIKFVKKKIIIKIWCSDCLIDANFVTDLQVMPRLSRSTGLCRFFSLRGPGFLTSCSDSPAVLRLNRRLRRRGLGSVLARNSVRDIKFRRPSPSERFPCLRRCPWGRIRHRCRPSPRLVSPRRHPSRAATLVLTRRLLLVADRGPLLRVSRRARRPVRRRVVVATGELTSPRKEPVPCLLVTVVDRRLRGPGLALRHRDLVVTRRPRGLVAARRRRGPVVRLHLRVLAVVRRRLHLAIAGGTECALPRGTGFTSMDVGTSTRVLIGGARSFPVVCVVPRNVSTSGEIFFFRFWVFKGNIISLGGIFLKLLFLVRWVRRMESISLY